MTQCSVRQVGGRYQRANPDSGSGLTLQYAHDDSARIADPRTAFGPAKYQRLVEVKRPFDLENVAHVNQNIPAG